MVENVTMTRDVYRDRREIKSFKDQLGIGLNMMITRLALLVAGWVRRTQNFFFLL